MMAGLQGFASHGGSTLSILGAGWPQWKPLGIPGTHLPLKRGSCLTVVIDYGDSKCHWCVTVKQLFTARQIISCPVIVSELVCQ